MKDQELKLQHDEDFRNSIKDTKSILSWINSEIEFRISNYESDPKNFAGEIMSLKLLKKRINDFLV